MQFIWAGERSKINSVLYFKTQLNGKNYTLNLCATDFYQVFADGKFLGFGPSRTASGYSRMRSINLKKVSELVIKVRAYNTNVFSCDRQPPFFGADIIEDGKVIKTSSDFSCYVYSGDVTDAPRYSSQRGYVELFDLTNPETTLLNTYPVDASVILGEGEDTANYKTLNFVFIDTKTFNGFDKINDLYWKNKADAKEGLEKFNVPLFFEELKGLKEYNYRLNSLKTGFIKLVINAKTDGRIICVFDELLPDGKWIFRRSVNNDFLQVKVSAGKSKVLTFEPCALKYLKIIIDGNIKVKPSFVLYENSFAHKHNYGKNKDIRLIMQSAENTFRQNAVDVFTDCPGRERAGWLCDSYFLGKAEKFFTGKNTIEKNFLENYVLADTPEIDAGMVPMCFPSEHPSKNYIPNWAMFFIIELHDYMLRSGDKTLIEKAKQKVYGILDFLKKYQNEYGLLENLEKWVFVEWSICNQPSHTQGVNYPSNMLYAKCLDCAGKLYDDEKLTAQSLVIKNKITELAFNGELFYDNAIRTDGKLTNVKENISETCQYYAVFCDLPVSEDFKNNLIQNYGPLNYDKYPQEICSNVFIGNFLRFMFLTQKGEYQRVLNECVKYFSKMAKQTGTLWEKDTPDASCCHGFASYIAVLLDECLKNL